ncbi:MAG: hypothetical protein PHU23_17750 [Dehalococcoidales bacterium]|nr:hypothetical protein [Dehalococcoidales bacterium]
MSDNEEPKKKLCPFKNSECTGEECTLFMQMHTGVQKFGTCSFNAMVLMLSEMNSKMQPPQQMINLPKIGRG